MPFRNTSPQEMFRRLAELYPPQKSYARVGGDFEAWKADLYPQVIACLGDAPPRVPLNPELVVEWQQDGLIMQRWMIDVNEGLSAVLWINRPIDLAKGERRPAIMTWHGHGEFGKDSVMGNDGSSERRENIALHNYDYGRQMAQAGYVTFAIDWIGCGDMNEAHKPYFRSHNGGRDWCNFYYLHATMMGMTSIAINVANGKAATDMVCDLPYVDPDRLGIMGLSGGGTMTLWHGLCDERFKALEIICYSDLWAYFGFQDLNYCGMQVAPGLYKLIDLPDAHGLLAPRPLLVDVGVYDSCFLIENALACFRQVEAIYEAAGARDDLHLDQFVGEHSWGANKSEDFFGKYL